MALVAALANTVTRLGAAPARVGFWRAMHRPEEAQRRILARILRDGAASAYGGKHGFAEIRTPREYAARVPLVDYDALAPWVERIAAGEERVLTTTPVRFMEPTGGSSGTLKLVPYTSALLGEFSAATMAWVYDLLATRPALRGGRAYWAITPPVPRPARTPGGLAVGMEHDSDYFPAPLRALLQRALAVPGVVARAPDVATCRYITLRALLAAPDLRLISVWSPSFLTLLAAELDLRFDELLRDLEDGGVRASVDSALAAAVTLAIPPRPTLARDLRRQFGRRPPEDLGVLWEKLALVSCWADGHAARALEGVRRRFPHVEVQPKGLLATEGVVSIPLSGRAHPVAAVTAHYLEFIADDDASKVFGVHELERGQCYEVVLTTGAGFYRYRLRDVVRVEGYAGRTPMLSFQGRADRASDIAGEKLTPALVERVIASAMRDTGVHSPFAMLAPKVDPTPRYALYVDAAPEQAGDLARAIEEQLLATHHYALCRALGQLDAVQAVPVKDGERCYERVCAERGQRAGAIKPPALEPALDWERHFTTTVRRHAATNR